MNQYYLGPSLCEDCANVCRSCVTGEAAQCTSCYEGYVLADDGSGNDTMTCKRIVSGWFDPLAELTLTDSDYPYTLTQDDGTGTGNTVDIIIPVRQQEMCQEGCSTCTSSTECTACISGYKFIQFEAPRDVNYGKCEPIGKFFDPAKKPDGFDSTEEEIVTITAPTFLITLEDLAL